MFSISLKQKKYKTFVLTDDNSNAQAEVVPDRGAIITRWSVGGQEILYLDEERFANPELSVRGGIPILFPICGNLPDNTYTYTEKNYTLKQHGFARDLPWSAYGEIDYEEAQLKLRLRSNKQTRAIYPFEFELLFRYHVDGNSLIIYQEYKNLSSEPLLFSTGLHPYFVVQDKSQLEFEIPSEQYQDQKTGKLHPFKGSFDFNRDEIDVAFKHLNARSATVIDRSRRLSLTLEYDNTYSTLVFWTLKDKNFYCLEPWSAARNSLNTGDRLTIVEPKANYYALVRLTAKFF